MKLEIEINHASWGLDEGGGVKGGSYHFLHMDYTNSLPLYLRNSACSLENEPKRINSGMYSMLAVKIHRFHCYTVTKEFFPWLIPNLVQLLTVNLESTVVKNIKFITGFVSLAQ